MYDSSSKSLRAAQVLWRGCSARDTVGAAVPRFGCGCAAACLFFLAMSWAALTPGTGYAALLNPASQQTSPDRSANPASSHPGDAGQAARPIGGGFQTGKKASVEPRGHTPASTTNRPPLQVPLPKVNPPRQLATSRQRSIPGNVVNLRQPASAGVRSGANGGSTRNETVSRALAFRAPSAVRRTAPLLNNAPHRRSNPAVVGGSLISPRSNTGAINGTRMNRKP